MKYPCIERTLEFSVRGTDIRLWIAEDYVPDTLMNKDFSALKKEIRTLDLAPMSSLIEKIVQRIPRVNAIQIKRGELGLVVYTVDFDNHG